MIGGTRPAGSACCRGGHVVEPEIKGAGHLGGMGLRLELRHASQVGKIASPVSRTRLSKVIGCRREAGALLI